MRVARVLLVSAAAGTLGLIAAIATDPHSPSEASDEASRPTYEKFETEARGRLGDCLKLPKNSRQECLKDQHLFIWMYVQAMTGDFIGSVYMIGSLNHDHDRVPDKVASAAVKRDPAMACAFAKLLSFTTVHHPNQQRDFHAWCDPLDPQTRTDAEQDLWAIGQELNMEAKPPPGWSPKIAGLVD